HWPGGRVGPRPADRVPARAGDGDCRHRAAGQHRRRSAHRAAGRAAPRGRAHHLPRHAQRRGHRRHRLGLLGCDRGRDRALCATVPDATESTMNVLFVADPLASFKTYKDSTFSMMRELQRRGHTLAACEPQHLQWQGGEPVTALVRRIELTGALDDWYRVTHQGREALKDYDAVLMRKDPPFDSEFFYATHLLEQAEREGARVFNKPAALRDHPEKLALMEFAQYAPPTLVTRSPEAIRHFHAEHKDIILKPLDGMGGMGIFRVGPDGMNLGSIIETLNHGGHTSVMVQRYLP